MYTLKSKPEDFIVEEIADIKIGEGRYAIIKATKTDMTTFKAVDLIAKRLNKKTNDIGYAGIKDKHAITTQFFSIKHANKKTVEKLTFDRMDITYIGQAQEPIRLGQLKGNHFTITVRNLEKPLRPLHWFPNYFDSQRFSENNIAIGKAIIHGDFRQAIELILSYEQDKESHIEQSIKIQLQTSPNNYVGALTSLQKKLLMLYVGAYQSYLFNTMLAQHIMATHEHETVKESFGILAFTNEESIQPYLKLPLIGFSTDETEEVQQILKEENITTRSFIVRAIPEATSPGTMRDAWMTIDDLKIEPHKNKIQHLSFFLKKGCYATMAIKAMYHTKCL
jgi:tRNA pseudouridine13 synthase